MALLRGNKGSRKLVEGIDSGLALLRFGGVPSITNREGRTSHDICASRIDPSLTGGSVTRVAFLRTAVGSPNWRERFSHSVSAVNFWPP